MSEQSISLIQTPAGYADWLAELKTCIHSAQQRAVLSVNRELVLLYWQIGRDILERQDREGWGAKVIERLAHDLRTSFPNMKGFSRANLMYMRAFAEAWPDSQIVQQPVGQLPWGHNLVLLSKLKSRVERLAYAQKTIENGWSRNVLAMQIETGLLQRQGQAISNFEQSLPKPCKSKNKIVAEYALRDSVQPLSIAEYKLLEALPETLKTELPSIEQIEREFANYE